MDQPLLEAFQRSADTGVDEVHMATLVARLLDPQVDLRALTDGLAGLADQCPHGRAPWESLAGLGFAGNAADYQSLDNSNLARVLATRRGIPITLAVVLMHVARAGGRRAVGVNFPGHFLAEVDGVLVDPFVMEPRDRGELIERLPQKARGLSEEALFAPASPLAVGLRMLNNIKLAFAHSAAWDRTLDVVDAQLALTPGVPALHLERGELWWRLGVAATARTAFQRALELAESADGDDAEHTADAARARLQALRGADDIIH
ncbi:MAG: tetratricopeptide repeat protein [Gammaproteobacteria bacterium]|nr:tetratricopeptide repeat protein [Gammaproteobacteria bacterium]